MATNDEIRAKDILPHKTAFSEGDGFYGDGDNSFFMEAPALLSLTSQAALAGNVAPEFVPSDKPNPTTTVAGQAYVYGGKLYVAKVSDYQGPWDASKFTLVSVSELFVFLKSYYEKPTTSFEDGYFVNYSNGRVQSFSSISASAAIDVRFATKIELVAYGGASVDVRGCAFYDENGEYISGTQYATNKNTLSLQVPANAATFKFSTATDKKDVTEFRYVDVFGCLKRIIDFAVDVIGEKWLACKPSINSSWTDNCFVVGTTGKIASFNSYSVSKIGVHGFKSLTFLADHTVNASDARGYAFYDENENVVSYGGYSVGTGTYQIANVPIPDTAYYFAFTGETANKSAYFVELHGTNDSVVKMIENLTLMVKKSELDVSLTPKPTLNWIDDYFVNGVNGSIVPYVSTSFVEINVRGFKSIKFVADYIVSGDGRGYAFYDETGRVVSCSKYTFGSSGKYVEEVNVPSNACSFAFTATTASKSDYYAELHGTNEAMLETSEVVKDLQAGVTTVPFSMFNNFASCGDSYTIGSIFNSSGVLLGDFPKASWGKVLERLTGVENHIYASGGATTKTFRTREACLPKILTDPARDLYIIALGINDYGSIDIGTISDINDENPELNADTYYGNYGYILAKIMEHAPKAKIVLLKSWLPKFHVTNPYAKSGYYTYMSSAIEALAEHFGCLFVDTLYIPFLCSQEYNEGIYGGHPTAPLYAGMAYALLKALNDLFTKNITYLADYAPS